MKSYVYKITGGVFFTVFINKGKIVKCELSEYGNERRGSFLDEPVERYINGKEDLNIPFETLELKDYDDKYIEVYKRLKEITEPGRVITYSELARITGFHPRFIGIAMRRNRFPLIIPCHRVVGKNGLGGFSYGKRIKRRLLEFEKSVFPLSKE